MRYLLPILPFTSILLAYVWRELTRNLPAKPYWRIVAGTSVITIFAYFFILRPVYQTADQQEFLYLTLPLILTGILGILVMMREIIFREKEENMRRSNRVALALVSVVMMTMVWAGLVEFFYDYPLVRQARKKNLDMTLQAAEVVADDALFFTTRPAFFFGLIDHKRIRFAAPNKDHFRDFSSLLTFHLQQGRAVYGAFTFQEWNWIKRNNLLDPYTFKIRQPIAFSEIVLCRILPNDEER
jgi:4-amino-4-deoxy-L-arabinose transferase-like glycosyltransferase